MEEVVQECLTRALKGVREGRLSDRSALGAYARGIARHVIAEVLRRRAKTSRSRVTTDPDALPASDDPLQFVIAEEERTRVREGLDQLSEGDREILTLSFYHGLRPREIAEKRGLSSQVIRKRKSRALQRLRDLLSGPGNLSEADPEVVGDQER